MFTDVTKGDACGGKNVGGHLKMKSNRVWPVWQESVDRAGVDFFCSE